MTAIKPSDKWIPWYFVAFFVGLAIVNGVFVYLATSTNTGVVTRHAYNKGLDYNTVIHAAETQSKLGWHGTVDYTPPQLRFHLTNQEDSPLNGAEVKAYFTRPTQEGYDFSLALEEGENGNYAQHVDFPLPGQWDIRIVAQWQNQQFQKSKRIVAP